MEFKNRVKNYGLWVAIFAFVPLLVEALSDYSVFIILPGNYDKLIIALLGILILAGILNNPTTEDHGYKDE
jgi:uncharacterized membrane protein